MRNMDTRGSETRSGANAGRSRASWPSSATIGPRTCCPYSALRARNHSRSLFRLSARRNASVFFVNGDPTLRADLPRGGEALLHLPREMRDDADHPLDEHQLPAMVHLVLFHAHDHLEAALGR